MPTLPVHFSLERDSCRRVPHSSRFLSRVRVFLPCGTPRARRKAPVAQTSVCGEFAPATWVAHAKINRKTYGPKSVLPASGKGRIEGQKTRTLEHTSRATRSSKTLKGWAPASLPAVTESTFEMHECVMCITEIALGED